MNKYISADAASGSNPLTLSLLTHEIRNPLTLISCEMQLLLAHHPELASYDGWNSINENLAYINNLLTELSSYQNAAHLSLKQTDPSEFLGEIAETVRPVFQCRNIRLETDMEENLPCLLLDQTKMRQCLFNLLRNARESIQHDHGNIHLSAASRINMLLISVSDNGCGIQKEDLEEIFQPFKSCKANGTGLGLAVTQQIILAHGGTLSVESEPEKGSTFTIHLPLQAKNTYLASAKSI